MKLSTKSQHAVTAMIDLALNDNVRTITLSEISKNQGISLSYLEQLFAKMRKAELVSGVRGPGGGYRLARKPYEITIAQIVNSIDEARKVFPTDSNEKPYVSHSMWKVLSLKINEFLNQMTLADFTNTQLIHILDNEQFGPQKEQNEALSASCDQTLETVSQSESKPLNTLYDQPPSVAETDASVDGSADSSGDTQTSDAISAKYNGRSTA